MRFTFCRLLSWAAVGWITLHCSVALGATGSPLGSALPDPLVMLDGRRVKDRNMWFRERRPELKALFTRLMYGEIPPRPEGVRFQVDATHKDFLEGLGVLKLVTISFGDTNAPRIRLMVIEPKKRSGKVPVFLAMNFCGNHSVVRDLRVPITEGWVYNSCAGCQDGAATEAGRGSQAGDWPVEEILKRGYALATFCTSDVDSDRADVSDGVYAWMERKAGKTGALTTHDRGSVAAWAWGYHRCVDYLVQDASIDARRIASVGHSRNGKTALLAAAFDDRIAMAIPVQAGCGGTAPSRGLVGESVKQINDRFPHWFNGAYKTYNEHTELLPFDQHCLVALCAPRPVLFPNATEDQWANPAGQFDVLRAAAPVYELLQAGTLDAASMPPTGHLVSSQLGYFIREGKHSMKPVDWAAFLDFADVHFRNGKKR
jgi:hypothetical protein